MAKRFTGDPEVIGRILIERIRKKLSVQQIDEKGLRAVMLRSALIVEAHTSLNIRKKLFRNPTGLLRSRVGHRFEDKLSLVVGIINPPPYARIHEFGFQGAQAVKQHDRVQTMAFGRPLAQPISVNVRAHTRQMNIPARPYLGPAMGVARKRILDLHIDYLRKKLGSN